MGDKGIAARVESVPLVSRYIGDAYEQLCGNAIGHQVRPYLSPHLHNRINLHRRIARQYRHRHSRTRVLACITEHSFH